MLKVQYKNTNKFKSFNREPKVFKRNYTQRCEPSIRWWIFVYHGFINSCDVENFITWLRWSMFIFYEHITTVYYKTSMKNNSTFWIFRVSCNRIYVSLFNNISKLLKVFLLFSHNWYESNNFFSAFPDERFVIHENCYYNAMWSPRFVFINNFVIAFKFCF